MIADVNQLAVALHYDRTGAPRVVAKGKGTIGAKIVEIAKAHDIPIEENEVLSLAMQHLTDADWIEIERGFSANVDPMRGVATAAGFDTLRRSIVERLNPARRERLSRTL